MNLIVLEALKSWEIALIVIGAVLAFIILVFICLLFANLGAYFFFKVAIKKHIKGLTVNGINRLDNINKLFAIIKKNKIKIPDDTSDSLKSINIDAFQEPGSEQYKKAITSLTYLREELLAVERENPKLSNNSEFTLAKQNILDMDAKYRTAVALYNADVLGYNYWITFLPYRWIFKMCKCKSKDLI